MFGPRTRRVLIGLTVLACVVGLTSCGSDSTSESEGSTGSTTTSDPDPLGGGSGVTITVASTDLGDVLSDGEGHTLYLFTPDGTGEPTCVDSCADAWPPVTSTGEPAVDGVDASVVSTVARPDGSTQVTAAGHPLYTFTGDSAPGDTSGQGSGGKWYVVAPDGSAIEDDASGGSGY